MARTYTKINWQDGTVLQPATVTIDGTDYEVTPAVESGSTPVNATNLDKMDTAILNAVGDINNLETVKIEQSAIELLEVTDTAPAECTTGDKYYNTTTSLIYTATGTNTWGTTGELPSSDYLYIDLANQQLYYYDGTNFNSYGGGGGSTEVYIQDTEPTEEDWKIWIDSDKQTDNTYYNDNGTPTNIKTTTYDTLPVGTEVDYDGETVPTGWTEITDIQPSIYSETETICGTWLGKPLYRKVFEITGLTYNAVTNYSHGISNVSFIKPTEVYMVNTNAGQVRSINYFGSWSSNLIQTNANAISYYISDSNFNEILAIVEYTKTTD